MGGGFYKCISDSGRTFQEYKLFLSSGFYLDVSRAKTNEPGGLSGTRAGSAPRAGLPGCAGCCGGVPPSRASQVFSQTSSPGVGDGGDRQTPGGSEAPGGARAPRRPRHAPQVVWRREGGARRPGPAQPGLLEVTPPGPCPRPPSLPLCRLQE